MDSIQKVGKKKWYLRWWMIVIYVIVVCGFLGSLGNSQQQVASSSNTSVQTTTQTPQPVALKVTASQLAADYKANEVAADAKYKDKLVEVTGSVDSIGKDILSTPYIALKDGTEYSINVIQCMFSKNDESALAQVSKDQHITLQGTVSGLSISNVIINDCKIVK